MLTDSVMNEVQDYSLSNRVLDYSKSSEKKSKNCSVESKDKATLPKTCVHSASNKSPEHSDTDEAETDENENDAHKRNSRSTDSGSTYSSDTNCISHDLNTKSDTKPTQSQAKEKPILPALQPNIVPQAIYLNDTFCPPSLPLLTPQLFAGAAGLRLPSGLNIPGFAPLSQDQTGGNPIPFTMPFGGLGNTLKVKLPFPTKVNIGPPPNKKKKSGGKPGRPIGRKNQIQSDKISTSTSKSNDIKKEEEFVADIPIKEEIEEPDEESASPLSGSESEDLGGMKSRRKAACSRASSEGLDEDGTPKARHNEPLSAHAVSIMSDWFYDNVESPYPSRAEMVAMAREGGIEIKQVFDKFKIFNWF